MKKILTATLTAALLFSSSSFALDVKSALTEDIININNNAANHLDLNLSDEDKLRFYDQLFKVYVQEGWNLKPLHYNVALTASKLKNEKVKYLQYSLSYEERTVLMNLVHYPSQKQILITTNEVLPVSTTNVLKYYNDKKEDKSWLNVYDSSTYSLFQKDGNISFTNYHVNADNSTVIYTSGQVFDYK